MAEIPPQPEQPEVPNFEAEFLKSIHAIEASSRLLANHFLPRPHETQALSKQLADAYEAGASTPPVIDHTERSPYVANQTRSPATEGTMREILALMQKTTTRTPGGRSGSTVTDPHDWRSRAENPDATTSGVGWLHLPGGRLTPYDIFGSISTTLANLGTKRETKQAQANQGQIATLLTQLRGSKDLVTDEEGNDKFTQAGQAQLEALTASQSTATRGSTLLGKGSNLAFKAQNAWVTGQKIKSVFNEMSKPIKQANQYAYEAGYQGGGPSFFGMRMPWSGATFAGIGQKLSETGFALNNNVTPGQAKLIYNQLFSQGWYGGGSTDAMRVAAANEMKINPMIGSSPQYYEMMDRSVRFGAASLDQFNAAMKQIPAATKAAHVGIQDMMASMDALGSYNTTIGGTYQQGMQNAVEWTQGTGMPATVMNQLMQNPLVQGMTYGATGLMPQMQGLLSPYQHSQGIFGALNLLNKAMITPKPHSFTDPITGLTQSISGQSQKEALMAYNLHIPVDQLHALMANQGGMLKGMMFQNSGDVYGGGDAGSRYTGAIATDVQQGNLPKAYSDLTTGFARLNKAMPGATDSKGHHMFEDWQTFKRLKNQDFWDANGVHHRPLSDKEAHRLAQQQARVDIANAGDSDILKAASQKDTARAMDALHLYGGQLGYDVTALGSTQRAEVAQYLLKHGPLSGGTIQKIAKDRRNEIHKYIQQNTAKFGVGNQSNNGPTLQIELGPAAKKMLHINDPNAQQKANVNAGSASVNLSPYLNGPTATPSPDLNTAAGVSTYGSGIPADASTYQGG